VFAVLESPDDGEIRLDPVSREAPTGSRRFDLVLGHLVLHHIPSLENVLKTTFGCLKLAGMAASTDFEDFGPEARRFHPEAKMDGVERHGIFEE
jgi:2-polyprenyl-3-methyl-5-hydroxy-6-metoxy-1,4-benzoquinol methylase